MRKHTPGPWRNVIGYDDSNTVIAGEGYNLECVALIKSRPSCQADACLIAAAPDLLEALEELVEGDEIDSCSRASAAIAKAKGEQP